MAYALIASRAVAHAQALDSIQRGRLAHFVGVLQDAVRAGDAHAIASMIRYPLLVEAQSRRPHLIRDSTQFISNFDNLFSDEVRRAVLAQQPTALVGTRHDVWVGVYPVWLDVGCDDPQGGDDCIKIWGLNSAHPHNGRDSTLFVRKRGLWMGFGVGGGWSRFTCDSCVAPLHQSKFTDRALGGWEISVALGWAPSPHVQLGGEIGQWTHGWQGDSLPALGYYSLGARYYPRVRGGPFVEGSYGLTVNGTLSSTGGILAPSTGPSPTLGWGSGYMLGVGWDFHGVAPRVTYAFGSSNTLHNPNGAAVATGWHHRALLIEANFRVVP